MEGRSVPGPVSAVSDSYIENRSLMHRYLGRFFSSRQDVEDVAQEAYLRAYAAERDKVIEQPRAFLFRIAKNVALTRLTRKSRQITSYIEDSCSSVVLATEPSTDEQVEAEQMFGVYCEVVASLPEKCRQVFLLRKVHGLAHKEIAERMSLSVSSVEKYLRQGLLACREAVDARQEPGPSLGPTVVRASKEHSG